MTTQNSLAGLETYENLNVEDENAYTDNKFKEASITKPYLYLLLDRNL
jgi:hypothetical protein